MINLNKINKFIASLALLFSLGIGNAWAGGTAYSRATAYLKPESPIAAGKVYVSQDSTPPADGDYKRFESYEKYGDRDEVEGSKITTTYYFYAKANEGYKFTGWYKMLDDGSYSLLTTDNFWSGAVTSGGDPSGFSNTYKDLDRYAEFVKYVNYSFVAPEHGSFTVTNNGNPIPNYESFIADGVVNLHATPAEGYRFAAWYTTPDGGVTKNYFSFDPEISLFFTDDATVGAVFWEENGKALFHVVNGGLYDDLNAAITEATSSISKTIYVAQDGAVPNGDYTIPVGVSLFVPYSKSQTIQEEPKVVTQTSPLSAYRTITLSSETNIICNGTICVGGQIMSAGGGKKSAYVTGECGVINMANGGHIELNDGAVLYCWGFVKGQDMDQGNNTVNVGTITVNDGAVVWENFEVGDWRGGTATYKLYNNSSRRVFPFQSYSIQNVEIPTTYKKGSTLQTFTTVYGDGSANPAKFPIIGDANTLFILNDEASIVRKWYDPTTDLMCYELSGTAQLAALNVQVLVTVSSSSYNLPISNSMHVVLRNCEMTLSEPIVVQAGAVFEIKDDATVNLETKMYMFDVDEWGLYIHKYYFRSFNNLTSHKNRGDEASKDGLEDAKIIIDGTLNVVANKGYLYTTAGGADLMGNGGGVVNFKGSLPEEETLYMANVGSEDDDYILWVSNVVTAANLHNEDGSYTRSAANSFYNIQGRWFVDEDAVELEDHTYWFTYMDNGNGGEDEGTVAVYSNDKTGLEAREKWFNVTENEGCSDWWQGQGEQSTWFYNYTLNSAWHQFIPTEMDNVYSGSNNKLYEKSACEWGEVGETDEDCLYTIGGVKKALVDGHFIALEANNNDPAFHLASDATQYYICFAGCNWHEATKYEGEYKTYVVEDGIYIWFEGAWLHVFREEPFFYTVDETNVKTCYEYLNGEWVVAEPYVQVVDALETRNLYFFHEALTVASGKKNSTITILRDIPDVKVEGVFNGKKTTCTLDLNGHTITGSINNLLTINGEGSTFTITDNTTEKKGKISMSCEVNARYYAVNVKDGTLKFESGTIFAENTSEYVKSTNASTAVSAVYVAAGKTFTMDGGLVHAKGCYYPRGIDVGGSTSANATVTINAGTINATSTQTSNAMGIYALGGTVYVKPGVTINATTQTTSAYGIYIDASTKKYFATLEMTGGTVNVTALGQGPALGVFVQGARIMTNVSNTTPNTIASSYLGIANISGGTFNIKNSSKAKVYGIQSLGTTTISGSPVFNVTATTTDAYGIFAQDGTTTINGTPTFTVKGTEKAYGIYANGVAPAAKTGRPYNPQVIVNGGTFNVQTTSKTKAYGIYVDGNTLNITTTTSGTYQGNYASAGNVTVNGGIFNVTAKKSAAYGAYVLDPKEEAGASAYDPVTANPKCTINGGYFKLTGTSEVNAVNNLATTDNLKVQGGYYSHNGNLDTYKVSPKQVLTLAPSDPNRPDYEYKVANAYLITFKSEDGTGDDLQSSYQEAGITPIFSAAEPTKGNSETQSFVFDGWATAAGGSKAYDADGLPNASDDAIYYAHFNPTTLKYRVHLDAATNGGLCETENIYVTPGEAVGTLPNANKVGHTFVGWFSTSATTGGTQLSASTLINANAEYFARFTVNSNLLTWHLDGGKVTTAGTAAAKNAEGSPNASTAYGTLITIPVVAKTGYTFIGWSPNPAVTMPDEAVEYTALWNPNTNTAYTVKHYLLNVDGSCPTDPIETESFTGTTASEVTPAVKVYDGFVSPSVQTATIAADGSTEVEYHYARRHYTFALDAETNGGTSEVPSIEVIHGATIGAIPPDAQKGCNEFLGWFTKPVGGVKITSSFTIEYDMKKFYAQFSDAIRTYAVKYLAGANGTGTVDAGTKTCGVDMPLSSSTFTRTGYTQTGWSTTDGGEKAYDLGGSYTANAALTLYPFWTHNAYTVTWMNGSTPIETDEEVEFGATPSYDGDEPNKPIDASYSYTFDGWSTTDGGEKIDLLPDVSDDVIYYAHYSTTPTVASVKVGDETTYYTDFVEAWTDVNLAAGEGTLKLLQDVEGIATSLAYTNAQNCTFDLNNHTLSGTVTKLIDVNTSGKTFTIDDSSDDKGGMISMVGSGNSRFTAVYITAGKVNLKQGKVYSKNTGTYNSSSAKNVAAAGVETANGGNFTMDGGTIESESQYKSYALFINKGTSSVVEINGGLIKGHTNKGTTACGIYNSSTKLTINNGHIVGHAWTKTSYGLYNYYGKATINGGIIEATNDTINGKGTTTAYGICTAYNSSTYTGAITIPSTSTVKVYARTNTTTAYAVVIGGNSTGSTIEGGTFTAKAGTTTAQGINSAGKITVSGGTFHVSAASPSSTITTWPCGIYATRGTVTVNGNPTFNVTSGAARAYGVFAYGTVGANGKSKYSGTIKINGGTFNVTTTTTTAYGAYAGLYGRTVNLVNPENATDTIAGTHYMPGIIEITDGTFNVTATTNTAYGIVVAAEKSESGAVGTTVRIPTVTVTGGKFNVTGTSKTYAVNTLATNTALVVEGGWYNINTNLSGYVAPTKDCNFRVLPLDDEIYKYKVAEAYQITFDNFNGDQLQQSYQEKGTTPVYSGAEPTKDEDEQYTYEFSGWSPELAEVAADATYTAQFSSTAKTIVMPDLTVDADETVTVDVNTNSTTTTIHVSGELNIDENVILTTENLILEATPSSSGEITGKGTLNATHAYYDLSQPGGFKAKTWYAVAVPWQVSVPVYEKANNGVYVSNDGVNYTQQELGRSFDLIYYDGARRATGATKAWKYVEDDNSAEHIMYPGRAYMIYLTSAAQTIRFERKADANLHTNTLAVEIYQLTSSNPNDANWNGIANPATYHAYIDANANTYGEVEHAGQIYDGDNKTYSVVNLSTYDLVVGQPVFVQAIEANSSVEAIPSHGVATLAPRRANGGGNHLTRYEVILAASEGEVSDRIIVRMDADKEENVYVVGQDLVKMGVSSVVPQLWVDRYDSRLCINTAIPTNNKADYPLSLFSPTAGEYTLSVDETEDGSMLYLTYDNRAIWNLSYSPYVLSLEKETNTHYGLRVVNAPQVSTDIEETTILNGDAVRKVITDDKVFIIRNGEIYSVTGAKVQ